MFSKANFFQKHGYYPTALVFEADWVNGLAIIRGLGKEGIEVICLSNNPKAIGFYSKYVNKQVVHPDPNREPSAFLDVLIDLAKDLRKELKKGILFPTSDLLLKIFSDHEEVLDRYFIRTFPDANVIHQCLDKRKQYQVASDNSIPIPKTYYEKDLNILEKDLDSKIITVPLVLKASHSFVLENRLHFRAVEIKNRQELDKVVNAAVSKQVSFIIQEVIPGGDDALYTFGSCMGRDGSQKAIFTGRKLRQNPPGFGICRVGESLHVPDIIRLGSKLLELLNFYGISQTEFKYDYRDKQFKLMEMNPRSWSWIGLPIKMGVNLPYAAFCDALDIEVALQIMDSQRYIWMNIEDDLVVSIKFRDGVPLRHLFSKKNGFSEAYFSFKDLLPGVMHLRELIFRRS